MQETVTMLTGVFSKCYAIHGYSFKKTVTIVSCELSTYWMQSYSFLVTVLYLHNTHYKIRHSSPFSWLFSMMLQASRSAVEGPSCLRRASVVNSILVCSESSSIRVQFEFNSSSLQTISEVTAKTQQNFYWNMVILPCFRQSFAMPLLCLCFSSTL